MPAQKLQCSYSLITSGAISAFFHSLERSSFLVTEQSPSMVETEVLKLK